MASTSSDNQHISTTTSPSPAPDLREVDGITSTHATTTDQSQQHQDSPPTTTSSNMPCPLLKLSAELRNKIWELAFTVNDDKDTSIDLFKAAGPSCALLMTCKKIHSEASGIFNTAQRRYWEETSFKIVGQFEKDKVNSQVAQIDGLRGKGVRLIKNISFRLSFPQNDIHGKVVAGTNNLAWGVVQSGNETDTHGSLILDLDRAHVMFNECEDDEPTVEQILARLRRIPSARRQRAGRRSQKKNFAIVWQFMIDEAERIAANYASFGIDLWDDEY